jgi:hypothetical protein
MTWGETFPANEYLFTYLFFRKQNFSRHVLSYSGMNLIISIILVDINTSVSYMF